MEMKDYINRFTKDTVKYKRLDNGLNVYIMNKENTNEKTCMVGTYYGSLDNTIISEKGKKINVPEGIAHFLEHKLFEQKDEDIMEEFTKLGADSNAYTTYDHTVYYIETINDIYQPLKKLIKMVSHPYFTDENVEKEKGIIEQEINMYLDNPEYQICMESIRNLYSKNKVRNDIAGTVKSISKINKELLYDVYNTYYRPSNMFVIVVGKVDTEKTLKTIENEIYKYYGKTEMPKINIPNDVKDHILKTRNKVKYNVLIPKVNVAYRLEPLEGIENVKRATAISIIDEMYFGKLSKFYEENFNKGKLNEIVSLTQEYGKGYSYVLLSTSCFEPEMVEKLILENIEKINQEEIDEKLLNIFKRKLIGTMIYDYEELDNICYEIIRSGINSYNIFEETNQIEKIDKEYIKEIIKSIFRDDKKDVIITKNNR